ncbi:MAG: hypothetical protein AB7N76_03510 [Planctomycetota bacterium]
MAKQHPGKKKRAAQRAEVASAQDDPKLETSDKRNRPALERGAALSFRTERGRYGVVRVIRESNPGDGFGGRRKKYLVALTAWSEETPPQDMSDARLREVQVLTHPPFDKESHRRVGWVSGKPPVVFGRCGFVQPTGDEVSAPCFSHCEWEFFPRDVDHQWRWLNEREAYMAERSAWLAVLEARQKERAKEHSTRKAGLTLTKLQAVDPTSRWTDRPADALAETRQILSGCLGALQALGKRKPKARVLSTLREAVEELNRANQREPFIETLEREDLCEHFDELAAACGLSDLGDFTLDWRDW